MMNSMQDYLDSDEDITPESYSAAGDSHLRAGQSGRNTLNEDRKHHSTKDAKLEKNPYSQQELQKFVSFLGFNVDETPRFTEMAKKLNTSIKHEPVAKDLTSLDDHDIIEDVSPLKKNNEKERQVHREALKRLIAKYKG